MCRQNRRSETFSYRRRENFSEDELLLNVSDIGNKNGIGWRGQQSSLFSERHEHRPNDVVRRGLGRLRFEVQIQKLANASHGQIVVVVVKWRKGILQDIAGVCEKYKRQHPLLDSLRIVDPLAENGVLNLRMIGMSCFPYTLDSHSPFSLILI